MLKERSLLFSKTVVRNYSVKKSAHKILRKFTCNIIIDSDTGVLL